jgi:hypothetical protein
MQTRGVRCLTYVLFGLSMALSSEGSQPAPSQASSKAPQFAVLVFTKTRRYFIAGVSTARYVARELKSELCSPDSSRPFTT